MPHTSWRCLRGSSMTPSPKRSGWRSWSRSTSSLTGVGSANGGNHIRYARLSPVVSWSRTTSRSTRCSGSMVMHVTAASKIGAAVNWWMRTAPGGVRRAA